MMRHLKLRLMGGSLAAAMVTALVAAPPAGAITGCPGSNVDHCYAIGEMGQAWTGKFVPINAVSSQLVVNCLKVDTSTDFVNYEQWLDTDLNTAPIGDYWVEGGAKFGIGVTGADEGFQWFWADSRPNGGGYHEHYLGAASFNPETVAFNWVTGTGNWNVLFNGTTVGTSVGAGAYAGASANGIETTSTDSGWFAWTHDWHYLTPSDGWQPVHTAGAGATVLGPPTTQAVLTDGSPGDGFLAEGEGAYGCPNIRVMRTAPQTFTGVAGLAALAQRSSQVNGDDAPTGVQYVETTRARAVALAGASPRGASRVYVLQLRGHFNGAYASVPAGHRAPAGNTLTIVVDAATGVVTDAGLTNAPVDLARLGTVANLSVR
jgi:hypothetical protein